MTDIDTSDIEVLLFRVLVCPVKPKDRTEGGIYLPEDTVEADKMLTKVGRVVKIGSNAYKSKPREGLDYSLEPHQPKVGDYVVFGQYAGQRIKFRDGREFVALNDTDILMKISNPEKVINYV